MPAPSPSSPRERVRVRVKLLADFSHWGEDHKLSEKGERPHGDAALDRSTDGCPARAGGPLERGPLAAGYSCEELELVQ